MTNLTGFELVAPDQWLFTENISVKSSQQRAREYHERDFKLENVEQRLEEYVRQWIARKLIEHYGYHKVNFSLVAASESFVNLIVRDDQETTRAFVAAGYFGAEDSDFAVAASALQSELDTSETVFFGLITDGARLAFLLKNDLENPRTINNAADFPTLSELVFFADSGEQPTLPPVADKFYKLEQPAVRSTGEVAVQKLKQLPISPAKTVKPVIPVKNQIKFAVNRLLGDRKLTTAESRKSVGKNVFRFAFAYAAVAACFVFVWYSNSFGSRPALNQETAKSGSQAVEPTLDLTESLTKPPAKPARAAKNRAQDRLRQPSGGENALPVRLSPIDATVMQIRSATKSTANKRQETQNEIQPPAAPKRSTTIEQPFYQSN